MVFRYHQNMFLVLVLIYIAVNNFTFIWSFSLAFYRKIIVVFARPIKL